MSTLRGAAVRREAPVLIWSLVLAILILGPGLGDGFLLVRDMVWVPDLALRAGVVGLSPGLPRAVPSDAVVAVLDELVPGVVLQKLVLVAALAAGGVGVTRLLDRGAPQTARLVAVTVYCWNALVAERLLIGAWPVLVGYAVLPWLLAAALRWRREGRLPAALLVLVPLGCLSASAGLASSVVVLAGAAGRGRTARALLLVVAGNAPWLVAGLLHAGTATSDARAAAVFALRGEGDVPGPLAALTLGGIWNTLVVPDSRTGALGWVALVTLLGLAALGARGWWRRTESRTRTALLVCWAVGFLAAVLTWATPDAVGYLAAHVPGAGVARDGARALVLCAPLLAVLVAEGVRALLPTAPVPRVALGLAGVLLPVALLPDLAWGAGGRLEPARYPQAYADARVALQGLRGDVLVLPLSSYRAPEWNHGEPVLDPTGRYLTPGHVASDVLVVDGVALQGEDPQVTRAARALGEGTPQLRAAALADLGVGAVVTDPTAPGDAPEVAGTVVVDAPGLRVVTLDDPTPRDTPLGRWLLTLAGWAAYLALPAAAVVIGWRRSRVARRL